MENILRIVLLMGVQASVLMAVVLALRLVLKKVPKIYIHILWLVVVARLLLPVFFESPVGVVSAPGVKETVVDSTNTAESNNVVTSDPIIGDTEPVRPGTDTPSGILKPDDSGDTVQTPAVTKATYTSKQIWMVVIFAVWVSGIGVMLSYVTIKYLMMRRKLRFATRVEGNVWECENVVSPFVMGFFAPKIYLPYGIPEEEKKFILLHEETHIRHFDTQIRMLVTLALCIHWWNPLVWLASHVIKIDMEMLCDESVLRHAGIEDKKRYSDILLSYAVKSGGIVPVLSFGESNTESRVKHIFRVRKPALIVSCVLIVAAVVSLVCIFSTKGKKSDSDNQQEVTTEEPTTEEPTTEETTEEDYDWTFESRRTYVGYMDVLESHCYNVGSYGFMNLDADDDGLKDRIYRGKTDTNDRSGYEMDYYIEFGTGERQYLCSFSTDDIKSVEVINLYGKSRPEIILSQHYISTGGDYNYLHILTWDEEESKYIETETPYPDITFLIEITGDDEITVSCEKIGFEAKYDFNEAANLDNFAWITKEEGPEYHAGDEVAEVYMTEYEGMPAFRYEYRLGSKWSLMWIEVIMTYVDGEETIVSVKDLRQ